MLYEATEKKEIERIYAAFADYIRESLYLEWFWSDKLGYLLLKIGAEKRYVEENVIIYTAEQLARILFSEVSMDVLQMTGNDHTCLLYTSLTVPGQGGPLRLCHFPETFPRIVDYQMCIRDRHNAR